MADIVFEYVPDWSAQVEVEPKVNKIQFGDGYQSRVSDGLNTVLEKWSVQFKRNQTEVMAIHNFLKARAGVQAFQWTTPDGYTGTFICPSWSKSHESIGWQSLSAKFEEVPEPPAVQ